MRKVYFNREDELIYFCELLFQKEGKINIQWEKQTRKRNELTILHDVPDDLLKSCMIQLFMQFRFHMMLIEVIQDEFYYDTDEDIETIVQWTDWIVSGNLHHRSLYGPHGSLQKFLRTVFARYIFERASIHFDEMCLFQRHDIYELLKKLVGFAIDERKGEEQYQRFIHAIRVYVQSRPSNTESIHILHNDTFQFYTYRGERITKATLRKQIEKVPLYIFGMDVLEFDVTPVITFLPKFIYVYTDDLANGKITTLRNIFEEKVIPLQKRYFPFHAKEY